MPNLSGIWTVTQQMQAKGASTWPAFPGAPTIGTATAGSSLCASVTFTAPGCTGYPAGVTGYRVVSTPGCLTATGASSPIVVTGLTDATSYTFKAQATNATGYGDLSSASNSITAVSAGSQLYATPGTYSWVAPTGVTSVSVVAVGAGAAGYGNRCGSMSGGGAGALTYTNNISVTPGDSYTVKIPGNNGSGGFTFDAASFLCNPKAGNGGGNNGLKGYGDCYGNVKAGTGYRGGAGGYSPGCASYGGGGGGAGGYSGVGGKGGNCGSDGCSGAGGGGGGGRYYYGGGGVGVYGQGSSGAGGNAGNGYTGKGGSSGANGSSGNGGAYGGGGNGNGGSGGGAAVRIVWPGNTRSFPSTNVGAP